MLHGNDDNDSDRDIVIDALPNMTVFDLGAIRHGLIQLLGVEVDVLTPNALPDKFCTQMLAEAVRV